MEGDRIGQDPLEVPVVRDHKELWLVARYDHLCHATGGVAVVDEHVSIREVEPFEVAAH